MVDMVVPRREIRETLCRILGLLLLPKKSASPSAREEEVQADSATDLEDGKKSAEERAGAGSD